MVSNDGIGLEDVDPFDEQAIASAARRRLEAMRRPKEEEGSMAGAAGGALSGAATGANIGSVVPVLGTTAGAVIGGLLGGLSGYKKK